MKKFFTLLFCLLFSASAFATVGNAGDLNIHNQYGVSSAVAIADPTTGKCASVDSDGNLQVKLSGGISGTFTASNVTVSEITPGTTAALLGKAEDAAHGSGDTGVSILAVRSDTAATSGGTDGDYVQLISSATGHLWTEQKGTVTEDAAGTAGGSGIYAFALRNDSLDATAGSDGDNANLQVGAEGALYTMGNKAEDAAATTADYGFPLLGVRTDTLASSSGTTGDYSWINLDALGAVYVQGPYKEDAAHSSGHYGNLIFAVRQDSQASLSGTSGDYTPLSVDSDGYLVTKSATQYAEDAGHTTADKGFYILSERLDTLASSAGSNADYASLVTGADGALYTKGNVKEDAAMTSGDYIMPVGAIRSDTLGTAGEIAGTSGDYAMLTVNALGALYVVGNKLEDSAESSGDNMLVVASVRRDAAAASSGTSGDYSTINTNSVGALYVSARKANTSISGAAGDSAGGTTILASAGASTKNRVYSITVSSAAAETLTITELSGFTKIYTQAGGFVKFDFGFNGILQTTAATAITSTSGDASACQYIVEYSTEAA